MNESHDPESGYGKRIAAALTVNNVVLFVFGVAVGAAVVYATVCNA